MAIDMSKSSEQRMAYVNELFEASGGFQALVNKMKNPFLFKFDPLANPRELFIRCCVDADLLTKAEAQFMINELNESTDSGPKETDEPGQSDTPTPYPNPSPNPSEQGEEIA